MPQEQLRHGCFSYRIAAVWRKKQKKKEKPEKKRIIYWTKRKVCGIIPSLTLVKSKSGYKPSSYAGCSHFLCGTDLCYFFPSSVLVLFIMLRMADFEINS
jgi:hypothetical protein